MKEKICTAIQPRPRFGLHGYVTIVIDSSLGRAATGSGSTESLLRGKLPRLVRVEYEAYLTDQEKAKLRRDLEEAKADYHQRGRRGPTLKELKNRLLNEARLTAEARIVLNGGRRVWWGDRPPSALAEQMADL